MVYSSSLYVNDRVNPLAWIAEEQNVGRLERGRAFMSFLPAASACPGSSGLLHISMSNTQLTLLPYTDKRKGGTTIRWLG
ncbi:hypothetical protein E2C01_064091 [Portunus trituberculatus]|uniref:Uncharacterized protein n=1 Tax=Portunus trituberculatus TaxID=210409 RepID=A0A5B7HJE8_PORTR|nr:hypothetical protein [Portunus trituberculatus]